MFQGTGSDVGKSLIVAGLCRAFSRRGLMVRPFKPQNMSNNAAVTADGGEIGRAQALQARACGVPPSVDMNPVLLKPQSDVGAQVVVRGRILGNARADDYQRLKPGLMEQVLASFERLGAGADLILIEGAGSPAEVNLRRGDIANMGFAEAADVPVVLIGDIDRGGVIASLVGTCALLADSERARLAGFLINKFRGDIRLFDTGLAAIEQRTGLRSFGVAPWFADAARLPAEDAVVLERQRTAVADGGARHIRIVVPRLPHIANFDDLDPLRAEADVAVSFLPVTEALPGDTDAVVLPGSKATLADLDALVTAGWDIDLLAHRRRGGTIVGLCGGYQMLGTRIADPAGIEGPPGERRGLGLLAVTTTLGGEKTLTEADGIDLLTGHPVRGYEMHVGVTDGSGRERPFLRFGSRTDGAVSADGRVIGCYLHGLFAADAFRAAFLSRLRARADGTLAYEADVDAILDRLADHLERHLDVDGLLAAARRERCSP
jgi:adenosylcobyric acid synthase